MSGDWICMKHGIGGKPGEDCIGCQNDLPSAEEAIAKWCRDRDAAQAGGTKYDDEKPRMALLDPYAMEELSKVLTFGAKKYDPWNWSKGIEYSRLISAALRHTFAFLRGEDNDPESGLPHLAHAMCCLMFCLSMSQRHPELDDRGPSGVPSGSAKTTA